MCDDLRKLGFSERKTKSLAVPNVPDKYLADFVRGYFDGDGSVWSGFVHKERITKLLAIRVIFTSCSKGFLEILKSKLEDNQITNGVLKKEKGNYCRLTYSIHGSLKLYNFMYNHKAKDFSGLCLDRKRKSLSDSKNAAVAQRWSTRLSRERSWVSTHQPRHRKATLVTFFAVEEMSGRHFVGADELFEVDFRACIQTKKYIQRYTVHVMKSTHQPRIDFNKPM